MIGKVIKSKFTSDSALNTLFGGRVFPVIGAQTKATPFAIYEVGKHFHKYVERKRFAY